MQRKASSVDVSYSAATATVAFFFFCFFYTYLLYDIALYFVFHYLLSLTYSILLCRSLGTTCSKRYVLSAVPLNLPSVQVVRYLGSIFLDLHFIRQRTAFMISYFFSEGVRKRSNFVEIEIIKNILPPCKLNHQPNYIINY